VDSVTLAWRTVTRGEVTCSARPCYAWRFDVSNDYLYSVAS